MPKKKVSTVLAVVTAVAVMAGCSGNAGNQVTPTASQNTAGDATKAPEDTKKEPLKITMMANLQTTDVPDPTIEKMIEEATNTELDIQWVPTDSYEEKINASFATNTLPKATYVGNLNLLRDAIRNDQFWEIGPMLQDYPNLSKLSPDVLKNTSVDGKIYALYQERPLSRQGIIYRKDWADKLGIEAPTTTDEFFTMLERFTKEDPDGNNKNDTIGLADRNDLIYGAFKTVASWFGTPNNWGVRDGKLVPEFMTPEYMDTMNLFKRLHSAGYMNQDFPVTVKADQHNLIISGKAGVYVGSLGDVNALQPKIAELNPSGLLDVQNRVAAPGKEYGVWAIPGYGAVVLFPKSAVKTEEELRGILGFYDQMMSAEMANLTRWGIEGTHYTVEDGMAVDISERATFEREVKPYLSMQIGGISTIEGFLDLKREPLPAKAEELIKDNDNYLIHDPAVALDSAAFNQDGARLQELIKDATYNYMLGNIDEAGFQAAVDQWLKQGGQKIIDEFNASYAAAQ
ncbi:extracellular solute-binding protein [Paenibacillus harenae]|uniref:extracellular solute-binding protein n=1 Tax=Paenibacillus harenae TaxID=306543 RepID=UPI0027933DDF|nr:extracellular solute-binding protein [Paenibacillus harenae]MDQ0062506.1 putative aldouronate transport system substrate-binding protein [Paenibacillus harenae]